MSDLTMCKGGGYDVCAGCERRLSKPSGHGQHYFVVPPVRGGSCDFVLPPPVSSSNMMTFGEDWKKDQAREHQEKADWSGHYDGTTCPNCNRVRMLKCSNGNRRCEKCNWDPDTGEYSTCPQHAQ